MSEDGEGKEGGEYFKPLKSTCSMLLTRTVNNRTNGFGRKAQHHRLEA